MKIIDVSKSYDEKEIFNNFSYEFPLGKITAVMGGSGVGKTTLLRMIAGLTDYQGKIEKEGEISYVFGETSLIPSLTVKQNLNYAVSHVIKDKTLREKLIFDVLKEVELEKEMDSYPHELSTGMAQRVSIARGFLYPASTVIMDEPFRGLDTALKSKLTKLFLKLLSKENKTVIFITHDITEAVLLADKIVVFGSRPIEIKGEIEISVPHDERVLSNEIVSNSADKLLELLEN